MSNLPSSPGSRPLEQLKVMELRDELRKRGLNLKGVKKELFERLEEAIKKEEHDGVIHSVHGTAQEGVHQTGTPDETEEFEEEGDVLDGTIDEAYDTMTVCQSDTSPNIPIPIDNGSTPFSETQALSGVSAPDGVPGFSEDMEQPSAAGAENVETNNDVLFVDNAVCGNGDVPENVPDVADVLEPGKECSDTVSDLGHAQSGNRGNRETGLALGYDSTISDMAVSEIVGAVPKFVFARIVNENIVSDVLNPPEENADPDVAVDGVTSVNDACGNSCCMEDVEMANLVRIQDPSLEIKNKPSMQSLSQTSDSSGFLDKSQEVKELGGVKTESLSISSCLLQSVASQKVYEPSGDSKSEELERPIVDERDMIINELKFNVGEREMTTIEEKLDVKMESMEIDTGAKEKQEVISEGGNELQISKEDPPQSKSPPEEAVFKKAESKRCGHDYAQGSRGEEINSCVSDDSRRDTKDDVDLKPTENDPHTLADLKRKDNDLKQEPAKRMRRWNSGNQVAVEALEPLTTDTVKEIMLPESTEGSSVVAQKLTPRATATSRSLPPKVKVKAEAEAEAEASGNTRTVPPSTRAPSDSLKIDRFVRPFTLKAVKDLLAEFGLCVDFWMDQIKTHCFVTYSSVNEAVAARNALYGRQWPPSAGNFLTAEFVDLHEVKIRSEGLSEKGQATPATVLMRVATAPPQPPRLAQSVSSVRSDSNTLPPSRFSRGGQLPPVPKKDPEPTVLTLEDLFCKTKAKPHIYYLPLTDEQVAEKIKNKQATR